MRPIVCGVTSLLLAVAAENLLTTLLLGVRERRRDVAILGAVGATRRQVTATARSADVPDDGDDRSVRRAGRGDAASASVSCG